MAYLFKAFVDWRGDELSASGEKCHHGSSEDMRTIKDFFFFFFFFRMSELSHSLFTHFQNSDIRLCNIQYLQNLEGYPLTFSKVRTITMKLLRKMKIVVDIIMFKICLESMAVSKMFRN